jgi:hypothetical protein
MAETYKGPEKRREDVRFEPDREDRRKNHGRRKEDLLFGGRS